MIFDDIATLMEQEPAYRLSRRLGVSRSKIRRLTSGGPFLLDYELLHALNRLGYDIRLVKTKKKL